MQHVQHLPIYFCNIHIKQMQHTSKTTETLETRRSIPATRGQGRRLLRDGDGDGAGVPAPRGLDSAVLAAIR